MAEVEWQPGHMPWVMLGILACSKEEFWGTCWWFHGSSFRRLAHLRAPGVISANKKSYLEVVATPALDEDGASHV